MSNANGGEIKGLDFPSVVSKCVWSKDNSNIFCAMMNGFADDAVMPNDWQTGKANSADTFWKINVQTGKKDRLVEISDIKQALDGVNLFLDKDEKYLFFSDRVGGRALSGQSVEGLKRFSVEQDEPESHRQIIAPKGRVDQAVKKKICKNRI